MYLDESALDEIEYEGERDEVDDQFGEQECRCRGELVADGGHLGEDSDDDYHPIGDTHGAFLVVNEQTVQGEAPQRQVDGEDCHEGTTVHRDNEVGVLEVPHPLLLLPLPQYLQTTAGRPPRLSSCWLIPPIRSRARDRVIADSRLLICEELGSSWRMHVLW